MKKTQLRFTYVIALLGILTFGSCQKEQSSNTPPAQNEQTSKINTFSIADNPNNPVEYVGQNHNALLDIFAYTYLSDSIVYNDEAAFFNDAFEILGNNPSLYDDEEGLLGNSDFRDYLSTYFETGTFSTSPDFTSGFFYYVNELKLLINDIDFNSMPEINDLMTQISDLEATVESSNLSPDEKVGFAAAASVARHSSAYWSEISINGGSDWNNLGPEGGYITMGMQEAKECAVADFESAVEGAVAGALVGGLAGIGPGALSGAVVGSARYTLKRWFGWFSE